MAATKQADEAVEQKQQETLPAPQMRGGDSNDIRREGGGSQGPREAVKAAGNDEKLTDEEQIDALDWFLSEDPEDWGQDTDDIEINVGTRQHEKWIKWTIRPVDDDVLREIQKLGQGRRRTRRPQEEDLRDELIQNARVIVKGTVYPDLLQAARDKGIADPVMLVRQRFSSKPGLIAQIAGEIMALSGFDADDVREAAANAASN